MGSLFLCLFHTRYNSQILRACYIQFKISNKFMAEALSVNTQNNHGIISLRHPFGKQMWLWTLYVTHFLLSSNSALNRIPSMVRNPVHKQSRIKTPDRYLTKWQQVLNSQQTTYIQILPTAATNEV